MSEKQVNIKITASTKDFDNAIKKAQKQIEDLADVIDSLGSSKFGDKLREQLDDLVKALKKTEDQVSDMLDSFNELGKTKLNKVEDEVGDVNKAVDKLNETSEEATESIEGINKVKFNKIEDQFKDIVDSGKDVSEKAKDILDLLDKVDKQDLNGLEGEFDQLHSALEKISTETRNSTDDMEKRFSEVTEEVNDFINKLNDVDYVHFNEFSDVLQDANRRLEELTEQQNKFNKEVNELDSSGIDKYADAMNKIDGANGNISIKNDSSNKGKGNSLTDGITEGLASSVIEGKILKDTMGDVADSIKDAANSMERLADVADNDIDKSIDELGEEYKEAESALEKLGEEYEKHNKELEESSKIYNELKTVIDDYEKEERELVDTYNKANDAVKKQKMMLEDTEKFREKKLAQRAERNERINEITKELEELEKLDKEYKDAADSAKEYAEAIKHLSSRAKEWEHLKDSDMGFIDMNLQVKFDNYEAVEECIRDLTDAYEDLKKKEAEYAEQLNKENGRIEALKEEKAALEEVSKEWTKATSELATMRDGSKLKDVRAEMKEELEKLEKEAKKAEQAFEDLGDSVKAEEYTQAQAALWAYGQDIGKTVKNLEQLNDVMNDHKKVMADNNKVAQDQASAFDEQYKAYEKLSDRVKAYLEDEKNGILQRERAAKSFKQVADAMEAIYKDSSKKNNADLITETLAEAAEYVKDLNLVSTENLQSDLKRLGEIIEDKTEKIKRFKELNRDFGSEASGQAYGIEKQSQAIRDWANSADFALEASKTLTNAWGDLRAAGEDHLKIRQRSKYIEDFGKALEENVAHIKNYYHELDTLDEIYEQCTDKQRGIIDDYRMWEKNRDALLKYNKEITDYMRTLRDTGGEIDSKFLDDLGNFNVQKFIDNFEKMGATSLQLQKHINAVKIELTESIKQYKDNADAARDNAKAIADNAKEVLDAAKAKRDDIQAQVDHAKKTAQTATSMEEAAQAAKAYKEDSKRLAEAIKEVEQAQEDYNQATKDADNWDDRRLKTLKEQIQEYNRLAAAMREIGMAANDLGKADIAKFDRSLASMLDRLDTFDDDIPKTFADIKEDIKALFSDMDSLDFGGIFDGLKEIGAGILSKIPGWAKAAAAAIVGITVALKECAEAGVNQFARGMDTVKGAISGIVNVARNVGQEIGDAFSNITGMELDFSSLMEIPVNFESMMAEVGAIAGATGDAFDELEDKARELGATTRYSAYEVAEAMKYMGMAGWDNKEIMDGLESVLNLATVANMDLGQASDFVTDGLTALGLEAKDASYMVDLLATASTSSNTTVAQMQRAFTNCAPVLNTLAKELENPTEALKDLSMALGLMADKGVKGAKAGTALKNLMANMAAPTEKQLEYIKAFNLEGAQQDITQGKLIDGIKKMQKALKDLTPKQQNAVITAIAGKEALSGVSALLNTTEEDLAKLESALDNCKGSAQEMADNFDNTLKGALKGLASAMQETLLQIFDKTEESIKSVTKELTEFFHILNGFSDHNGVKGLAGALEYLEEVSQGWGKAITDGITKAIGAIDEFVNSKSFDKLLQIGTNIINGIADGIQNAADNGTLGDAISTAIGKIATWFSENLDTIVEVGKEVIDAISDGISENQGAIGEVIRSVIDMQTTIDTAVAKEKWKLIGSNLGAFIVEGFTSKVATFFSGVGGFLEGLVTGNNTYGPQNITDSKTGEQWMYVPDYSGMTGGQWIKTGQKAGQEYSEGVKKGVNSKKEDINATIDNNFKNAKPKTDATAASIGQGISDNIVKKLETMDTGELKALRQEMLNLQTTVSELGTGMATSFTQIRESSRENFMNLANIVRSQMTNVANIVINQTKNARNALTTQFMSMEAVARTQIGKIGTTIDTEAVSWYNVINNQVTNARNAFTRQFMSMAAVARTQMVNVSNIISNQARSWYNVINNQITNARNAFTSQMISMAKVASTQMNKISSTIKSSMDSIGKNIGSGVSSGLSKSSSSISNSSNNFKNTLVNNFKKAFGIHSPSTVMRDEVGVNLALGIEEGLNTGANNISTSVDGIVSTINNGISGINTYDGSGLININASEAEVTNKAMKSLIMTLTEVGSYIDNAGLAFKVFAKTLSLITEETKVSVASFDMLAMTLMDIVETISQATVSFAAFGKSITGISESTAVIRESFLNIANIVNNQVTNARNALTQQFMSMEAVSRTQMSKVSDAIRSNAMNWNNIISNQAKNARDNFTRQFMSMASVCSTQMAKCLSSVKSYMSKIASATNKKMSMSLNVNRNVSTSYAAAAGASIMSADALYAANSASTYSLGGNTGALASRASSAVSSGSNVSNGGGRGNSNYTIIEVPVNLDGKQIAKASAKYVDNELKTMANRENRKRGAK